MDHPLYMGVHVGPISPPPIVARMDEADFVLNLGCLKTDMNFGNRPPHIIEGKSVWAVDRRVDVKYHTYMNVGVRDFVRALLQAGYPARTTRPCVYADNLREAIARSNGGGAPLRVGEILTRGQRVSRRAQALHGGGRVGRHAVRRTGRARAASAEPIWRRDFTPRWASRCRPRSGAQVGSGLRPIVLCGDGGFQMTGRKFRTRRASAPIRS